MHDKATPQPCCGLDLHISLTIALSRYGSDAIDPTYGQRNTSAGQNKGIPLQLQLVLVKAWRGVGSACSASLSVAVNAVVFLVVNRVFC
jgi:hypothetical protein